MKKYAWIYAIVAVFSAIWLGRYLLHKPVKTQVVYKTTYEEKVSVAGLLLRNEIVYTTSCGGVLESSTRENERVFKGKKIATVYKDGIDSQIKQDLDAINQQIERLQTTLTKKQFFSSDLASLESQIKTCIIELTGIPHTGNYNDLAAVKEELDWLVSRQTEISDETDSSPKQSILDNLIKERKKLESQIDSSKQDIYAQAGGIYSTVVDGLENILVPDNIKQLTVSDFKNIKVPESRTKKQHFDPGDAVCKTVDNSVWMCAALLGEKDLLNIKEGGAVRLRFPEISSEAIGAKVEYISPVEDGEAVVVLSANQYLDSIYTARSVNFEIIKKTYQGLSVPISALRINNEKTGVFVNRDGIARFCEVNILYKDDSMAIVEDTSGQQGKLKLYDPVIVNGTNIEDGKIVN